METKIYSRTSKFGVVICHASIEVTKNVSMFFSSEECFGIFHWQVQRYKLLAMHQIKVVWLLCCMAKTLNNVYCECLYSKLHEA